MFSLKECHTTISPQTHYVSQEKLQNFDGNCSAQGYYISPSKRDQHEFFYSSLNILCTVLAYKIFSINLYN